MAKNDYAFYLDYANDGLYTHGQHTRYIAKVLERVEKGEIKRVMFFLPPRSSKSYSISEAFPSWYIGRDPNRRVILTSYGDDLARDFGIANKRKIEEHGPSIFGVELDPSKNAGDDWEIDGYRGRMISSGIGGAITGKGADLMIIDDPVKNQEDADSPTKREKVWKEWQSTLLTRLQPDGAVILVMTRWHEDDLAGRLLKASDDWEVVRIPAIAEANDILGREIGDPIWASYGYDKEWARKKRQEVGSRTWNALYQQRPSAPEGSIIKEEWWKFYDKLPEMEIIIQSWDLNFKKTEDGSYVVGQVWGRSGGDYYLIDQTRRRMGFVENIGAIRAMSHKYPEAIFKFIEDKANGSAMIDVLRQEIDGIMPVSPRGDKTSRANAVAPLIEAGNVYLPNPSRFDWVNDFMEEWRTFPLGSTDDMVDTSTQALSQLRTRGQQRPNYSGKGRR